MNKTDIDGFFFFDADLMPAEPVIVEVGVYSPHAFGPLTQRYPKCKLAAVEASPTCFGKLKLELAEAFGELPYPCVTPYQYALAPVDAEIVINEYRGGLDANSVYNRDSEKLEVVKATTVTGLTLGSLLNRIGLDKVDLLLLNCEGAELFALRQLLADVHLRARIKQIGLSFHCDHVKIYGTDVRDEMLEKTAAYYDITKGTDRKSVV